MAATTVTLSTKDTTFTFNLDDLPPGLLDSFPELREVISIPQEKTTTDEAQPYMFSFVILVIVIGLLLTLRVFGKTTTTSPEEFPEAFPKPLGGYQVFSGQSVPFDWQLLDKVLTKYFVYYQQLSPSEKNRFIDRLQKFIAAKTFIIPAADGYREMPILVSASAIQLTFGLKEYLLPWFENICVHPAEYMLPNPLRTLAGNVSGNTITLSWKHFLSDYEKRDGVNVGLHEMAHALQMQCEYFYTRKGRDFREHYDLLETLDEHIISKEKMATQQFYSSYALTNTDEFWASSVELFFEKPKQLQAQYPQVYDVLKALLKQDLIVSENHPCIDDQNNSA